MYTLETLNNDNNASFDMEYGVNQRDVDIVNELIPLIESTAKNSTSPIPGAFIVCKGPKKVYGRGHLENENYLDAYGYKFCVQPSIPNVGLSKKMGVGYSTSGGYWVTEKDGKKFKYVGTRKKLFWTFGHNGACGNGGVYFQAEVAVFEYEDEKIY